MDENLAYCGIECQTCPVYLATRIEDPEEQTRKKTEIAHLIRKQYGTWIEPDDITACDGCRTASGRLFVECRECFIRSCAQQKGLENCAFCTQYTCERLLAFFTTEPAARRSLDRVRISLNSIAISP